MADKQVTYVHRTYNYFANLPGDDPYDLSIKQLRRIILYSVIIFIFIFSLLAILGVFHGIPGAIHTNSGAPLVDSTKITYDSFAQNCPDHQLCNRPLCDVMSVKYFAALITRNVSNLGCVHGYFMNPDGTFKQDGTGMITDPLPVYCTSGNFADGCSSPQPLCLYENDDDLKALTDKLDATGQTVIPSLSTASVTLPIVGCDRSRFVGVRDLTPQCATSVCR
jgi:hypothetical protein